MTSIAMILCDGDDRATIASKIQLPTYIAAEEGNDELNGGGGPNILLGGDGDDRLTGGSSQDILVGGDGADRIVGNGGDDILIAGTLDGAADPIDQLDALLALLAEWDLERNRTQRNPALAGSAKARSKQRAPGSREEATGVDLSELGGRGLLDLLNIGRFFRPRNPKR